MNLRELKWSKSEKQIARMAFEGAYKKECDSIKSKVIEMIDGASKPRDLWRIHDYLTEQRDATDEKYDYRYSVLPAVFARLLKDGWLTPADLEGLGADKIEVIHRIAEFSD